MEQCCEMFLERIICASHNCVASHTQHEESWITVHSRLCTVGLRERSKSRLFSSCVLTSCGNSFFPPSLCGEGDLYLLWLCGRFCGFALISSFCPCLAFKRQNCRRARCIFVCKTQGNRETRDLATKTKYDAASVEPEPHVTRIPPFRAFSKAGSKNKSRNIRNVWLPSMRLSYRTDFFVRLFSFAVFLECLVPPPPFPPCEFLPQRASFFSQHLSSTFSVQPSMRSSNYLSKPHTIPTNLKNLHNSKNQLINILKKKQIRIKHGWLFEKSNLSLWHNSTKSKNTCTIRTPHNSKKSAWRKQIRIKREWLQFLLETANWILIVSKNQQI